MSCPTCDHTMESIGHIAAQRVFRCGRCGTVKIETYTGKPDDWNHVVYVPKLVERCRPYERGLFGTGGRQLIVEPDILKSEWHRLGIAESINKPEDRP